MVRPRCWLGMRLFIACRAKCSRVDYESRPCTAAHDRQCKGWVVLSVFSYGTTAAAATTTAYAL